MKKEIILPAAAWLCGLVGFGLRRWELAAAYDPELGLLANHPAGWLLWGLGAVLLVALCLLCRGMGKKPAEQWFYAPVSGYIMLSVCAGLVLMMAGGVSLWEQLNAYMPSLLGRAAAVCCILGGAGALVFTRKVYRGLWSEKAPLPLMFTCLGPVLWLICLYQRHARQPVTGLFVWQVLASVALVLALYGLVTMAMEKGSAARTCVACLMSLALIPVALADGSELGSTLVWIFAAVYLTAQSYMLLRGAFGRPWPERMPQGADDEDEETDRTEE